MLREDFLSLKLLFSLLAAGMVSTAFGTPGLATCGPATLAGYVSSSTFPTGGCEIGILDYYTFSYHPISNAPSAGDITVTPSKLGTGFAFTRTDGTPFTANLGQVVSFEIDYNILIDPAPIITGGDMSLDPPTGNVLITEFYCNDLQYVFSGFCFSSPNAPETLKVGTPITGFPLSAAITFASPALHFEDVGILFRLDGTNGPSTFDGLDSTSIVSAVPEPASAADLLLGLIAFGGGYTLRKRRYN